jgi:hypothetical protein
MWQTVVVLLLVAVAAVYVGRRLWRTLRPARTGPGCDAGCGCDAASDAGPDGAGDWSRTR